MRKLRKGSIKREPELTIEWHPEALRELEEIEAYILQFSVQGAENIVNRILAAAESLQTNPERFQRDRELSMAFRRVLVNQYKIIFENRPQIADCSDIISLER